MGNMPLFCWGDDLEPPLENNDGHRKNPTTFKVNPENFFSTRDYNLLNLATCVRSINRLYLSNAEYKLIMFRSNRTNFSNKCDPIRSPYKSIISRLSMFD